MVRSSLLTIASATLAVFIASIQGRAIEPVDVEERQDGSHWINTWTSMPQLVESGNMPPSPFVRVSCTLHRPN
jgi:hypothetical protein